MQIPSGVSSGIFWREAESTKGTITHEYQQLGKSAKDKKIMDILKAYGFKNPEIEYLGARKFGTSNFRIKGKKIATFYPDESRLVIFTNKKA